MLTLKQRKELMIFRTIFPDHNSSGVTHRDSPDFLVSAPTHDDFGVEVTELYHHKTQARLVNIPNYAYSIITKGQSGYKDKADKKLIYEVDISVEHLDGNKGLLSGIATVLPSVGDHRKKLVDAIISKNSRVGDYKLHTGVSNMFLIIMDFFEWTPGQKYSSTDLMTPELEQAVKSSDFTEIYVLTRDGGYIPLKMLMLGSEMYNLFHSYEDFDSLHGISVGEMTELLVRTMNLRGMSATVAEWEARPVAVYGMTALAVRDDGSHIMFDMRNNPQWSENARPHKTGLSDQVLLRFDKFHQRRFPYSKPPSVFMKIEVKERGLGKPPEEWLVGT